ncbi:MAG: ribonuclease T2 family protein [Mycobacterium sp.]
MRRGDRTVIVVTVALSVLVVAAVAFSLLVLDRKPRPSASPADSSSSLLVVTWAPSLCKVEPSNSGCRSGHVGSLGRSFVLHGLWPQPSSEQYCAVPKRTPDRDRKPVELPADLQASLKALMSDSTLMTTHEWYAHGTCSGVTPPEYFSIAAALADEASAVLDPVFAGAAGRSVSSRSVRDTVDSRLGAGAGKRVSLTCRDAQGSGTVAYEVRLSLPPVPQLRQGPPSLADALAQGPPIPPGCGQARVP